jgi:hypothetical protein
MTNMAQNNHTKTAETMNQDIAGVTKEKEVFSEKLDTARKNGSNRYSYKQ